MLCYPCMFRSICIHTHVCMYVCIQELPIPADVRTSYLFNSRIQSIEDADLVLLVGTNPRMEVCFVVLCCCCLGVCVCSLYPHRYMLCVTHANTHHTNRVR